MQRSVIFVNKNLKLNMLKIKNTKKSGTIAERPVLESVLNKVTGLVFLPCSFCYKRDTSASVFS